MRTLRPWFRPEPKTPVPRVERVSGYLLSDTTPRSPIMHIIKWSLSARKWFGLVR